MPGVIALIMVFSRQTKMAELYGIRDNEMGYYLAFACVIIPFSLIMDVFVLNTQEVSRLVSAVIGFNFDSSLHVVAHALVFSTRKKCVGSKDMTKIDDSFARTYSTRLPYKVVPARCSSFRALHAGYCAG